MKVKDTIFVHWQKYNWQDEGAFRLLSWKSDSTPEILFIKELEVEFDVPDSYDPVPDQIVILKSAKQKLMAETQVKVNNIDEQIQSLLAIEDKS